jgi:hypothetical protein
MNATPRFHDDANGTPRVRRTFGDPSPGSWSPSAWAEDAGLPLCLVQGYAPQVYRMEQGCDPDRPPQFGCPYDRMGPPGRGGCDHGHPAPRDWKGGHNNECDDGRPSPRDCSIRPDQQHCGFLPGVQCDTCKRIGHVTTKCDMLAMAIYLDKYIKQSLSEEDKRKIESSWLCMWKEKLGQPQQSPTQVMKAYCMDLDISLDHLVLAMDWDCWPVDECSNFASIQGLDGGIPK